MSLIVSLALGALAVAVAPVTAEARATRPRIVALGDSLTSGHGIGAPRAYPAILQERLARAGFDFAVVNAGISGETSAQALRRLDYALYGDVRVLIVALGANDGLRGVPVPQLKANLSQIIETAQRRGISVLLCGMEALPLYGWDYSARFHHAYRELAARYRVPLVPFMLAGVIGNPRLMQPDHVHPNADGAKAIADNIWPYLKLLAASAPVGP